MGGAQSAAEVVSETFPRFTMRFTTLIAQTWMDKYFIIFAGAGLGGVARFAVGTAIMNRFTGRFPLGTFLVNVSGCFLVGLIMTVLTERLAPHQNWRLFLVVGFLGGYTTFSSFAYSIYIASTTGLGLIALADAVGSVVAGVVAVWLGVLVGAKR